MDFAALSRGADVVGMQASEMEVTPPPPPSPAAKPTPKKLTKAQKLMGMSASPLPGAASDANETDQTNIVSSLKNVNIELTQGKIYAVVGAHSSGKSSFLRLLGKAVHPSKGEVFVPPHLSIIHVEQYPQVVRHMSLFDNLTLGHKYGTCPPLQFVTDVCESLGMAPKWLLHLQADFAEQEGKQVAVEQTTIKRDQSVEVATKAELGIKKMEGEQWQDQLSSTDRHLIHIARALITNPHVLVLHRPLASLDEDVADRVMKALRSFIKRRGLYTDQAQGASAASRLSRTVIFSTSTKDERAISVANEIIVVRTNARAGLSEEQTRGILTRTSKFAPALCTPGGQPRRWRQPTR